MSHSRWRLLPPAPPYQLSEGKDLSSLLYQLLYNRGLTYPARIEEFLAADERLCTDPFLLPDMSLAVNRIFRAILAGEEIVVFGDFDVDGICATSTLVEGISALGGKVSPYIPHRSEGYGLTFEALERLHQQGTNLVITADCGISAYEEVRQAQALGLDMLVTDPHSLTSEIPQAQAVVNPKRASPASHAYHLAGVGVAFKVVQALFQGRGKDGAVYKLLDLVALGTVADMSPLVGDNRYLVKQGLDLINRAPRPGIAALMQSAGLNQGSVETKSISWLLAPRLNAAGRLDEAANAYELLQATSVESVKNLVSQLEAKNVERQKLTSEVFGRAREVALTQQNAKLLFVGGKDFPSGVVGIVAGKLVEEFHRPAFVLELGDEVCRGSARSIPEFDIVDALKHCSPYLIRFGGHPLAAGYTLTPENVPVLHQHLMDSATKQLADCELCPTLTVDASARLSELNGDFFNSLQKLAPFGIGNPVPSFVSRGVKVLEHQVIGAKGEHIRLKLKQNDSVWPAVGFRLAAHAIKSSEVDIVYNLTVNQWSGQSILELNLLDIAPSQSTA